MLKIDEYQIREDPLTNIIYLERATMLENNRALLSAERYSFCSEKKPFVFIIPGKKLIETAWIKIDLVDQLVQETSLPRNAVELFVFFVAFTWHRKILFTFDDYRYERFCENVKPHLPHRWDRGVCTGRVGDFIASVFVLKTARDITAEVMLAYVPKKEVK